MSDWETSEPRPVCFGCNVYHPAGQHIALLDRESIVWGDRNGERCGGCRDLGPHRLNSACQYGAPEPDVSASTDG